MLFDFLEAVVVVRDTTADLDGFRDWTGEGTILSSSWSSP